MAKTSKDIGMMKAQSDGYEGTKDAVPMPESYRVDAGLKSAWEYGRALGDDDILNRRFKPSQSK